jgi:hypothetical protein
LRLLPRKSRKRRKYVNIHLIQCAFFFFPLLSLLNLNLRLLHIFRCP